MRLFLPGIPHTVTHRRFSHCAFTMKVLNAAKMWAAEGFTVVHLGVEGAEFPADIQGIEHVSLMSQADHLALLGLESYDANGAEFIGNFAQTGLPVYQQFNYYLRQALRDRLEPGDVLCLPFGAAHNAAWEQLPLIERGDVVCIETGIGYPDPFTHARVYESEAWRHWVLGSELRNGADWQTPRQEWVVPNYYDLADWPSFVTHGETPGERRRVVFLGRLIEAKGLAIVPQLARARRDLDFILCGQGDPSPFCTEPNVHYQPPIHGAARAEFLGHALCGLYPSRYVEPFCGAAVETMLVGTPVITSDFGAFTETVEHDATGYRCRTLDSWLLALDLVGRLDRSFVRGVARLRYGLHDVGKQYRVVFDELVEKSFQPTRT